MIILRRKHPKFLVILNMFYQYNYTCVQNHCYDSILKLSTQQLFTQYGVNAESEIHLHYITNIFLFIDCKLKTSLILVY